MKVIEPKVYIDRAKKDYSSKEVASRYIRLAEEVGLWKSEAFVFEKFVNKDSLILDVGCGAGRTTFGLFELGYRNIVGVDVSKTLVSEAKKRSKQQKIGIVFDVQNVMNLKFRDNSFDVVLFSYNGLMTIPGRENREIAMKEIARVLKSNGLFVFTTHDREADKNFLDFWKNEEKKWKSGTEDKRLLEFGDRFVQENGKQLFVHFPNTKEVYSLCAKTGFAVKFTKMRWDICATPQIEKENFGECRFFVAQKTGE